MHYTSVLFDLDGTLLDTLGDLTAAMNRTLTRHGLPERTRQQMRTALGNGARRLMELSVPSGTDSALFETLLAEYNADYAAHCRIETAPTPASPRCCARCTRRGASSPSCPTSRTRPCAHCVRISSPTQSRSLSARRQPSGASRRRTCCWPPWNSSAPTLTRRSLSAIPRSILPRRAQQICRASACCGAFVTGTCSSAPARSSSPPTSRSCRRFWAEKIRWHQPADFYAILRRRNFSFVSEMRMATRISAKPTITRGSRCS